MKDLNLKEKCLIFVVVETIVADFVFIFVNNGPFYYFLMVLFFIVMWSVLFLYRPVSRVLQAILNDISFGWWKTYTDGMMIFIGVGGLIILQAPAIKAVIDFFYSIF
jgi:hypothetical protein